MKKNYIRKISGEEAEKQFIMIVKNELHFFPEAGEEFQLLDERTYRTAKVESFPCHCMGPEEPHEHYYIAKTGLRKGDVVEIRKEEKNEDHYILKLNEK